MCIGGVDLFNWLGGLLCYSFGYFAGLSWDVGAVQIDLFDFCRHSIWPCADCNRDRATERGNVLSAIVC